MSDLSIMGVVLAGGLSRRMGGGDKFLRALGRQTLMDQVIARLSPQVEQIIINANGDPTRIEGFDLPVVSDSIDDFAGPLAGVLAGMDAAAKEEIEWIVTVAADTPFFPEDLIAGFANARGDAQIVLATSGTGRHGGPNLHPTFGLWSVGLRETLREMLLGGTRKVLDFVDAVGPRTVADWPIKPFDPFFNVNRPEDMDRAKELLEEITA